MNTLDKKEGVYYTQMADDLPIEERVFFREGKGVSATSEYFRIATDAEVAEVAEWEEYKRKQEEEHQSMMGYEESNA
jgi:hypothetical protein